MIVTVVIMIALLSGFTIILQPSNKTSENIVTSTEKSKNSTHKLTETRQ